jgi:hypothetical protein
MRTTTTKRSLGNACTRPHEMKFRSLEQNKDPKINGKIRHTLPTSNTLGYVRSKSRWITHKWWHPMARILWALTQRIIELHEDIRDMCEVPQMNNKSEFTQGNLDDVWHERRNCEKTMQATDHWRLFAFNSKRPLTMKISKAKVQTNLSRYFWSRLYFFDISMIHIQ